MLRCSQDQFSTPSWWTFRIFFLLWGGEGPGGVGGEDFHGKCQERGGGVSPAGGGRGARGRQVVSKGVKVLETAVGAIFAPTRFSLVRICIRHLVADGKSLVRNSGVGGGGQNRILRCLCDCDCDFLTQAENHNHFWPQRLLTPTVSAMENCKRLRFLLQIFRGQKKVPLAVWLVTGTFATEDHSDLRFQCRRRQKA